MAQQKPKLTMNERLVTAMGKNKALQDANDALVLDNNQLTAEKIELEELLIKEQQCSGILREHNRALSTKVEYLESQLASEKEDKEELARFVPRTDRTPRKIDKASPLLILALAVAGAFCFYMGWKAM